MVLGMSSAGKHGTDHAVIRAQERYGLVVTDADMLACVTDIIDSVDHIPRAILLVRFSQYEIWWAHLKGVEVRVCYCPLTARIISVLPRETKGAPY
jgi:hypothetical protein